MVKAYFGSKYGNNGTGIYIQRKIIVRIPYLVHRSCFLCRVILFYSLVRKFNILWHGTIDSIAFSFIVTQRTSGRLRE